MNKTGERLNHILDLIGFRVGRGRIPDFQEYVIKKELPELGDLKYSTVRSWFNNHAPPMKKVSLIIDALHHDFEFSENVDQVKVWWKLGGIYPFRSIENEEALEDSTDKLQFLITSMVKDECGEDFKAITSSSLIEVKNKAIALAKDFADPSKIEVPSDYLRIFIAGELRKSST